MNQRQQQENHKTIAYYCDCLTQIKVYKNQNKGGEALNQPILLLSVIDLIARDIIKSNWITISDELIETFQKYWSILTGSSFKSSDFALPFFHLKNAFGKFWHLQFSERYEGGRPQSIPKLKGDVNGAALDEELFELLRNLNSRQEIIDTLISSWFSVSQKKLEDILDIELDFQNIESEELKLESSKAPNFSMRRSAIREAFFRKAIVHAYEYRCAFCHMRVIRSLDQNIVDGAHIKPFSIFYDSRLDNGLSLCKNHHWAFDRGWFSLDDNYKIIVVSDLEEASPYARTMIDFHGESILLPSSKKYFPRLEALQWHRDYIFKN
jgi:putative restriction endonuclease